MSSVNLQAAPLGFRPGFSKQASCMTVFARFGQCVALRPVKSSPDATRMGFGTGWAVRRPAAGCQADMHSMHVNYPRAQAAGTMR